MPRITFENNNTEGNIKQKGEEALKSRSDDLKFYMTFGPNEDDGETFDRISEAIDSYDIGDLKDLAKVIDQTQNLPAFHEYGLSFDYVKSGTFEDQEEDYYRYQFSWGGPAEELRIYDDGDVEFVYLDWFSGVGFDVTTEDWIDWVKTFFEDIGMINFIRDREKGE